MKNLRLLSTDNDGVRFLLELILGMENDLMEFMKLNTRKSNRKKKTPKPIY
ncbi:hypothetical protein PBAL39_12800 [Pedobacter sp. BAL39]|uniref:hypothetical protein n=1 Tax=Pedobacter sp. BAL39 TaxID=391596 RepID=UPI0001559234|nr:hypothetical protein [Pedobacter sp. BAL39]EDM35348.1 hypothetical protein PBAL39_12800 [Pedobacter sp. BAL39]